MMPTEISGFQTFFSYLKYEILWICAFSFLLIKFLFEQDKAFW